MMEPTRSPTLGARLLLPILGLVVVAVIALFVVMVCGGEGSNDSASGREPTPAATEQPQAQGNVEEVLAAFVRTNMNAEYAGDCSQAQTVQSAGKVCSIKRGERDNVQAYVLGLALSEPTQWALLEQRSGSWQVVYAPKITPDTRVVPGIPWPLRVGAEVVVIGTGACLNVRTEPRIAPGNAVDCVADGTRIRLASGPVDMDGIQWWQVEGRSGWVASDYLRYPDATQDQPQPTARPQGGTPGPNPSATPRP